MLPLANGWRLARRMVAQLDHVELEGPDDTDTDALRTLGFTIEIVNWRARVVAPAPHVLDRLFARWPLLSDDTGPNGHRHRRHPFRGEAKPLKAACGKSRQDFRLVSASAATSAGSGPSAWTSNPEPDSKPP